LLGQKSSSQNAMFRKRDKLLVSVAAQQLAK